MQFEEFDADKQNFKTKELIEKIVFNILKENKVQNAKEFAERTIRDFKNYNNESLNKTLEIQVFRPHEFDDIEGNDKSLEIITKWLSKQEFDWRKGSELIKQQINKSFKILGNTRIQLGETYLTLDNLIEIEGRKIAIEIETSGNIDNGFYTLRQAIKKNVADFGIMIAPLNNKANCADEKKLRERLDNEFDGKKDIKEGPIYGITILRLLDVYLEMKKQK